MIYWLVEWFVLNGVFIICSHALKSTDGNQVRWCLTGGSSIPSLTLIGCSVSLNEPRLPWGRPAEVDKDFLSLLPFSLLWLCVLLLCLESLLQDFTVCFYISMSTWSLFGLRFCLPGALSFMDQHRLKTGPDSTWNWPNTALKLALYYPKTGLKTNLKLIPSLSATHWTLRGTSSAI